MTNLSSGWNAGAKSLNFWNSIQKPTMMMERKRNLSLAAYLSTRETHLHRKKIHPQACRFMLPWQPRAVQPCLDVLIFHLNFEIREILHFIAFHWNRTYFVVAASFFLFFSPGWDSVSITWDFSRFFSPFARAENPSPVFQNGTGFSART